MISVVIPGPERKFAMTGRSWAVRWFDDLWAPLPEVRRGLFGRGVIAVSEEGHDRVATRQPVIADELAVSLSFKPDERTMVFDTCRERLGEDAWV